MSLVKAYDDIPKHRETVLPSGQKTWKSMFFDVPTEKSKDGPVAFLMKYSAGRKLFAHFHQVDQFQVVFNGDGQIGRHDVPNGAVHFTHGCTPYGPIRAGEEGIGFLTLRAHEDPDGIQKMPDCRAKLDSFPNRKPWQTTAMPDLDLTPGDTGVAIKPIDGLKNDRGLAGHTMALKPGARAFAPHGSHSDGQYILVMRGSIRHEGQDRKNPTVIWVGRDEQAFQLQAGDQGCVALVLTFPVPGGDAPKLDKPAVAGMKTYQCVLCAYVYDEAEGVPSAGVAPGTPWTDVPEDFSCPDCDGTKADFQMIEI